MKTLLKPLALAATLMAAAATTHAQSPIAVRTTSGGAQSSPRSSSSW